MLGRLNAAYNQAARNLDHRIDDASEHFVYVPKKCTANVQDVAFFLSTRLDSAKSGAVVGELEGSASDRKNIGDGGEDANRQYYREEESATRLQIYEGRVAELASEFEGTMVRFDR